MQYVSELFIFALLNINPSRTSKEGWKYLVIGPCNYSHYELSTGMCTWYWMSVGPHCGVRGPRVEPAHVLLLAVLA